MISQINTITYAMDEIQFECRARCLVSDLAGISGDPLVCIPFERNWLEYVRWRQRITVANCFFRGGFLGPRDWSRGCLDGILLWSIAHLQASFRQRTAACPVFLVQARSGQGLLRIRLAFLGCSGRTRSGQAMICQSFCSTWSTTSGAKILADLWSRLLRFAASSQICGCFFYRQWLTGYPKSTPATELGPVIE